MRPRPALIPSFVTTLALGTLCLSTVAQTCPPQGATLTISPAGPVTLGTPLNFFISGTPLQPYALFMDFAANPVQLPGFGCVYLALTPSFRLVVQSVKRNLAAECIAVNAEDSGNF